MLLFVIDYERGNLFAEGKMRKIMVVMTLIWVFVVTGRANAQVTVVSKGESSASTNLVLTGTILSTIGISLNGSIDHGSSAVTVVSGSGTSGTISFGPIGLANTVTNGEKQEVLDADGSLKGFYLVATVSATVKFSSSGGATAALDIQRVNPCSGPPDIPCGSLFFARSSTRDSRSQSWIKWTNYPDLRYGSTVFDVAGSTHVPGSGNLALGVGNGEIIDHQLAVWIPKSVPAGDFATPIKYTATLK